MELNKKCFVRFGGYNTHPKDAEAIEINFPEDTLFFTGGPKDIGDGKHDGAFHVLAMTRASDEELRRVTEGILRANIVTVEAPNYTSGIFRVNGYAFIELNDCISNEFEFTDVNTINDILDFKKHPIYIILLNDEYMISNITRIDRINSFYKVEHTCIQLYTQIGSRYFPMICPKEVGKLYSLLHPFHKFSIYIPEEHYGKELFDECLYTVLSHIYPKYNEKLRGYDMNYINREYSSICTSWKEGMEKLRKEGLIDEMLFNRMPSPQLENVKNFIEKLPIKENM